MDRRRSAALIGPHVKARVVRQTAATVILLLGVHDRAIMSILVGSSAAGVSRYAHLTAPIRSDVANRLDGFLWSHRDTDAEANRD